MKPIKLLILTACLLTACQEKSARTGLLPNGSETVKTVLSTPPATSPAEIHSVRNSAKPGDEITLKGRIMGNAKPFVEGRAAFILADTTILAACNDKPGDNCETPWDSCCNTPEEKKKGIATIQIVGSDGRVLKESIEGLEGLVNLASVTVTGKVAPGSSAEALVVNASAIRAGK